MNWFRITTHFIALSFGLGIGAWAYQQQLTGHNVEPTVEENTAHVQASVESELELQKPEANDSEDDIEVKVSTEPADDISSFSHEELLDKYNALLEEHEELRAKFKKIINEDEQLKAVVSYRNSSKRLKQQLEQIDERLQQSNIENSLLMNKLKEYDPEAVKNLATNIEVVKDALPQGISRRINRLSPSMREKVVDFHQNEDQHVDESNVYQQSIYDFITSHYNGHLVNISSLKCKNSACELYLEEKINRKTLKDQGISGDELKAVYAQEPAFKTIVNDLKNMSSIEMTHTSSTSSRFTSYMLFKVKWR